MSEIERAQLKLFWPNVIQIFVVRIVIFILYVVHIPTKFRLFRDRDVNRL